MAGENLQIRQFLQGIADPKAQAAINAIFNDLMFILSQYGVGVKNNLSATTVPSATDDSSAGYVGGANGSIWMNTVTGFLYICQDATVGAASWEGVSSNFNPS